MTSAPRTADRYVDHAGRIGAASPTYAAWSRSVAGSVPVVAVLDRVPPTKRQPELVFAVARRLGADPADPGAIVDVVLRDPDGFVDELAAATMQANDPQRMAAVLPLFAEVDGPIGIVDVGASAGLCGIPDRVTLDYEITRGRDVGSRAGRSGADGVGAGAGPDRVRMVTSRASGSGSGSGPASSTGAGSIVLRARASGWVPAPFASPDVVARVSLDPSPIDLDAPGAFDRLVEAVPPEATDRTTLMRAAASVARTVPPVRVVGGVPDDLERALAALPAGCTPVVVTMGTLVYVPGAARQEFIDSVRRLGVRWIAMERTGILHGVAATLPGAVDPADPAAFATVSIDGEARAVADAHGTAVRWLGRGT
ncbi:DUF2332 family protein [Curtobacterium sp. Leaf261]|uniref:DUF2332 family protein n=1 Tax=Curtobacterium sp. Leaf261 TaxID=1736311 RepID=UPI0006FD2693|nr:DUF2332 family protein [Curtobacterium sp. Leaf261]KQO63470.1 hypothetical protein ASF23_04240 [Curtobacterium sp. Leaf261]